MNSLQEARQILRTKVQDDQKTPEKDQLRLKNRDYLCDKVSHLSQEAWNILVNNAREIKKALAMSDEAYQLAAQCDYIVGMADMLSLQGIAYLFMGEYDTAIEKVGHSLQLSLSADHRYGQASAYTGFGSIYAALGEQNRALYYYTRSSSIFEELDVEDMRSALALYGIGQVYLDKKEPLTALPYFEKSLQYYRNANIQTGIARSINVMGNVWLAEKQYDKALECAFQSLELFKDVADNGIGKSRTLNDLGRIYQAIGDREQALAYFNQALQHRLDTNYRAGIITTYTDLGRFHLENQVFDQAKECLIHALDWCKNVQVLFKQATIHRLLSELYKAQGNFELALEEYERYHFLHEKATVEDASNQTKYLQMVHDIEKTAQENEVYRLKNIELAGLNQDLEHALEMIKDSLNYARRIQNIILPEAAELKTVFADAFVFYSPRDIVSGDFYWLYRRKNWTYLAIVDCTGHGVPGAFMSLLGYSLLNQIIKEKGLSHPTDILHALDQALVEVLKQRDDLSDIHDGMDVALLAIDNDRHQLFFAGANEPLYYIRGKELTELEPGRSPLGGSVRIFGNKSFPTHVLEYQKGDILYLFSDGFKDQFGLIKESKRKYSSKRFRELLAQICGHPMDEQQKIVEQEFNTWKGELRQTDDVIVVGIRL